jgi:hypothetical protein
MPKQPRLTAQEAEALLLRAGSLGFGRKEAIESTKRETGVLWYRSIPA